MKKIVLKPTLVAVMLTFVQTGMISPLSSRKSSSSLLLWIQRGHRARLQPGAAHNATSSTVLHLVHFNVVAAELPAWRDGSGTLVFVGKDCWLPRSLTGDNLVNPGVDDGRGRGGAMEGCGILVVGDGKGRGAMEGCGKLVVGDGRGHWTLVGACETLVGDKVLERFVFVVEDLGVTFVGDNSLPVGRGMNLGGDLRKYLFRW